MARTYSVAGGEAEIAKEREATGDWSDTMVKGGFGSEVRQEKHGQSGAAQGEGGGSFSGTDCRQQVSSAAEAKSAAASLIPLSHTKEKSRMTKVIARRAARFMAQL
jgi:hypothetical protein